MERRRLPAHLGVALGGMLLCVVYAVSGGWVRSTVIVLASGAPAAVVLADLARRRLARPAPWWCLAAGLAALTVNGVVWLVQVGLGDRLVVEGPLAAWALLTGYVLVLVGAVLLITPFARRDGGTLVEAGVAWLASASVLWVVLVHPALVRQNVPDAERFNTLLTVLLVSGIAGMVLRLAIVNRPARPALLYLLAAVSFTLLGTVARVQTYSAADGTSASWLGPVWIVAYGALAAAAVHPARAALTAPGEHAPDRLSVKRLSVFGLALGLNPVLAGIQQALHGDVDWMLLTVSTLVIVPLVVVRIGRLVHRQEEAEATLAHHATHDELTGLANRRAAITHLGDALARAATAASPGVAVLFLDIDGLKVVNDRHGHRAGDAVICAVARRVARAAGTGALVARLGGDELLVVAEASPERRDELVAAVRAVVRGHVDLGGGARVAATAALGATWVGGGEHATAAQVIADADRAMYADKRPRPDARESAEHGA
ncbi:GGDEF domain-containing protein [Cellulomonas chengniuliangii]|uniref:GGDEF domain-containing protein n=1 Tax=Cellulomonas chengniuliangii TaxID=2968084 RepID=A0ABY5KWA6_9CELL|nr:GGDEF domain-containing protein [Cellulomonas chengniuliangii]MCC2309703.1 GGDEF domain-containing protein [Cellulomonas chengniuliangii]UUI74750.1 GGDEF domain-containing protein [Cellulomonas chengniuliangii]